MKQLLQTSRCISQGVQPKLCRLYRQSFEASFAPKTEQLKLGINAPLDFAVKPSLLYVLI